MDTSAAETIDLQKEKFAALGIRRKWASQSHKIFMIECLGFPATGEFYAAIGKAVRDDLFKLMILRSRLEFIGVAIVTISIALITFIGIAWLAGGTLQLNLAIGLLIVILAIMIGFAQSPKLVNINAIVNATNAEKALTKKLMRFRQAAISGEVVVGGEKQVWTRSIAVEVGSRMC